MMNIQQMHSLYGPARVPDTHLVLWYYPELIPGDEKQLNRKNQALYRKDASAMEQQNLRQLLLQPDVATVKNVRNESYKNDKYHRRQCIYNRKCKWVKTKMGTR